MTARLIMGLQVAAVDELTPTVKLVRLRHPRRPALPAPEAGAHVDVHLPDGRVRQYSLCGDPGDAGEYAIAIQREDAGRGGSRWLHEQAVVGATWRVSAPRNHFALASPARRHVFVAGGIGITPFLPLAMQARSRGEPVLLHFCARSASAAPLLPALRSLVGPAVELQTWFADAQPRQRFDAASLGAPADGVHVYACGPARLIDAVLEATATWPEVQVHVERFAPLDDAAFVPQAFSLELTSDGRRFEVPAERSALEVLREAGLSMPSSCELGVCGACECGYRAGEVIHRDVVLGPAARRTRLMPCVSRARGHLLLDL